MSIYYDPSIQRFRSHTGRIVSRRSGMRSSTGRKSYYKSHRTIKKKRTKRPKQKHQTSISPPFATSREDGPFDGTEPTVDEEGWAIVYHKELWELPGVHHAEVSIDPTDFAHIDLDEFMDPYSEDVGKGDPYPTEGL